MADQAPAPAAQPPITQEMAEQTMRQGELFLQAQLQAGLASDQRALTMAAFFASVGAAIAAAVIAYWDRSSDVPILVAGLVGFVMMIAGACICLWAARPIDFFYPGNHPESWFKVLRKPLYDVMLGEAENYQDHIEANAKHLDQNGKTIIGGAALAVAAPLVGVLLWIVLATTCSSCRVATDQGETRSPSSSGATSYIAP